MAKTNRIKHIAIIPDGNRRWARLNKKPIYQGHRQGAIQLQEVLETAYQEGVQYLTIWIASESNLQKRSKTEVKFLISLFALYFKKLLSSKQVSERQIKVKIIGKGRLLVANQRLNKILDEIEKKTAENKGPQLTFLFGYNGTTEMLEAIKAMKGKPANEENLRKALWTGDLPDLDLIIRTGGEPHNSAGFMMWHGANSQYYFTKTLWPDFGSAKFIMAIKDFKKRERRMGK